MQSRFGAANEQMRDALARVSPGTPLRDGIDRVVRAKAGALLVLSDGADVLSICSGGFLVDAPVQPATAVRAGEDGRRDHHLLRRRPHRQGQRPPGARPDRADERDRHPAPHRRARRPVAGGARRVGVRGDGRHQRLRRRWQAHAPRGRAPPRPRQPGACRPSSATRPGSTTPSPTSPRSRSKTSPACATSSRSCSGARWCTASRTRSRR